MNSPYQPETVKIIDISEETLDVKTFTLDYSLDYLPGQFFEVGLYGVGEAPITCSSSPTDKHLQITVKKIGKVTSALHGLKKGDMLTIRGPYGNSFPFDDVKGEDLLFIGGGIGLPPLKSQINRVLSERESFGRIHVLYGARDETQIVSKDYLTNTLPKNDVNVKVCVDCKLEKCTWPEHVCLIPDLIDILAEEKQRISDCIAFVCGPPVMIKFVVKKLLEHGLAKNNIITTLERQMRCGIGKCGHCIIGEKYVCIDGPVFTYLELEKFVESPI